jgi:hypothetical protein
MHGRRLYERRDLSRLSAEDATAVRDFLAGQRAFQDELLADLRVDHEALERNSLLIWTWDYLSLALCLNWRQATAEGAPTATGQVDIEVEFATDGIAHIDPWPFALDVLTVRAEGRRLPGRFDDEAQMRRAFATAPWETLELRLKPRPG